LKAKLQKMLPPRRCQQPNRHRPAKFGHDLDACHHVLRSKAAAPARSRPHGVHCTPALAVPQSPYSTPI
jgi:hypothetical protein